MGRRRNQQSGGVNGKKLEMIVLDTQADPQLGIQAVNRLSASTKCRPSSPRGGVS